MFNARINTLLNLKVARDRKGMAPNKPLLVLAILDLGTEVLWPVSWAAPIVPGLAWSVRPQGLRLLSWIGCPGV
jgi:hypothetical protein